MFRNQLLNRFQSHRWLSKSLVDGRVGGTKFINFSNQKFSSERNLTKTYSKRDEQKGLVVQDQEGGGNTEERSLIAEKYGSKQVGEPLSEEELETMYLELLPKDTTLSESPNLSKVNYLISQLSKVLELSTVPTDIEPQFYLTTLLTKLATTPDKETLLRQLHRLRNKKGNAISLQTFHQLLYLYSNAGNGKSCADIVQLMDQFQLNTSEKSWSLVLLAYQKQNDLPKVVETYKRILAKFPQPSLLVYSILTSAYLKAHRLEDAFGVYELIKTKPIPLNAHFFALLIQGCIQANQLDRAWSTFDHMRLQVQQPDLRVYTLLFKLCQRQTNPELAFNLFQDLLAQGLVPNVITLNSLIYSCKGRPDFYLRAKRVVGWFETYRLQPDHYTWSLLLSLAAQSKSLSETRYLALKLLKMDSQVQLGGTGVHLVYFYLFLAYANAKRITKHVNRFDPVQLQVEGLGGKSPLEVLDSEGLRTSRDIVVEATFLFRHYLPQMGFKVGSRDGVVDWYLTILANYNYRAQLETCLDAFYPNLLNPTHAHPFEPTDRSPTDPFIYGPNYHAMLAILAMAFRLKDQALVDRIFCKVELHFQPLYHKSKRTPMEKDRYLKLNHMTYPHLTKFFITAANGYAKLNRLGPSLTLLEHMFKIPNTRKFLLPLNFPTVLQKVLDSEDKPMRKRLETYLFKVNSDPIAKNQKLRNRVFKKTNPPNDVRKPNQDRLVKVEELL